MVTPHRPVAIVIGFLFGSALWMPGRVDAQADPARKSPPAEKLDLHGDPLPPGAVLRLGTVRYRQDSPVYRIAWTPNGKHFVTDGQDSILRVWDAAAGRIIRRIDPGVGVLEDFAIASRGPLVLASGESLEPGQGKVRNVTLTHLGTGRIEDRGSWPDEGHGIRAIALDPDRRLVAIGTDPSGVRVLDAWNGAEVCRFETGGVEADRILFSRDGKRLAVETDRWENAKREGFLRIYDLVRKQELRVLRESGHGYSDITFSPDGSTIATADISDLDLWLVASGERIPIEKAIVQRIAYSADSRALVGVNSLGQVKVFDPASRKVVASSFSGISDAEDVALSPDGRTLLIVGGRQAIHAWDVEARRDRFVPADAHVGPVKGLVITPDGKTLITAGADKTVRLWDLSTGKPSRPLWLSGPVEALAFSPDGRRLAAATFIHHQVFVWDLPARGGPIVLNYARGLGISAPLAMRFLDAGTILLVDEGGRLHRLDVESRRTTPGVELRLSPPAAGPRDLGDTRLKRAAFLPGGKRLAALGIFSGLHLLELVTGKELYQVGGEEQLHASPDGRNLVGGGERLVASPDGRILAVARKEVAGEGNARRLSRVGGRRTGIDMGAAGGEIGFIDAGTGKDLRRVEVPGSELWAMAFSPDGKTLAATSGWETGEIHLYEVESGREARTIVSPPLRSSALAFTPDGSRLVSGMADGSILVWDVRPAR